VFGISVARRLLNERTLEYQGHTLTLSSGENDLNFSLIGGKPAGSTSSSSLTSQNVVSSGASAQCVDEILTEWWRPHDSVDQTKQMSSGQHSSSKVGIRLDLNFDSPSGAACSLQDSVSSSCYSQISETGSTKDSVLKLGKDVEDNDVCESFFSCSSESSETESTKDFVGELGKDVDVYEFEKTAAGLSNGQLDHGIEVPVSEEYQCRKIPFSDEKLRLIYKLITNRCSEFRAEIRVKLDKCMVKISGAINDVEHTDVKLHELVVSFVSAGVSISKTSAKLLSTKIGEDWLDARLANEQLVAVFYVQDTMAMIMTDCQDRLAGVKRIIESLLVKKYRQLERHHTKLLHSAVWNECIESLQSAHLLQISVECVDDGADMRLVVEGCVDSVQVALDKLGEMLGENSRISHSLKLRCGVYRVLCFRSREIQQEAKYVALCFKHVFQNSCAKELMKRNVIIGVIVNISIVWLSVVSPVRLTVCMTHFYDCCDLWIITLRGRLKVKLALLAETENRTKSGIWLSAEAKCLAKVRW